MTTLRDALSEAIESSEAGTLEAPAEVAIESDAPAETVAAESAPETAEAKEARQRDEKGRFAAKQAEAAQAAPIPQPTTTQMRTPPSSWSKDQWERWNALPPETQDYLHKREADYAKGVSTYKGQWDQAQPLIKAVEPFMQELQQQGITPDRWISNLGNAHRWLTRGTPEQKTQIFAKLATEYGVSLQALTGGQVDPQFGHLAQTINTLQNKLQNIESTAAQREQQALQQQIDQFAQANPHFEAVKQTMSQLLGSGVAGDLKTAYDKAIRLHDDIWQQHQAQQAKDAEATRQADIARKRAAAVSPRSASPTGSMASDNTKKGLRASLSESFDAVAGGRF